MPVRFEFVRQVDALTNQYAPFYTAFLPMDVPQKSLAEASQILIDNVAVAPYITLKSSFSEFTPELTEDLFTSIILVYVFTKSLPQDFSDLLLHLAVSKSAENFIVPFVMEQNGGSLSITIEDYDVTHIVE